MRGTLRYGLVRITRHAIGKGVSRWFPIVGALGVGAYAYYDTGQVARTTIELYTREIDIEPVQHDLAAQQPAPDDHRA